MAAGVVGRNGLARGVEDMNTRAGVIGFVLFALFTFGAVGWDLYFQGRHGGETDPVWFIPDTDLEKGRQAFISHGCGSCHAIPGVGGATGRVGPKLSDFKHQTFIAGLLPNRPDNLIRWIREPQAVNPGTAMPNLPVSDEDARNIAAFLYSLD
jgi:cytochrome c